MPSLSFFADPLFAGGRLTLEQLALALGTEAIPAKIAIAPDNPVARHDQRHRICGAGASDCALGIGLAQGAGDVAIAAGLAEGDAPQLFPHAPLEGGPADIERKVDMRLATRDEIDDRPHC